MAVSSHKLKMADEWMEKGNNDFNDGNFAKAAAMFKRALDIWVKHYGKYASECFLAYYKYGLALLYEVPIPMDDSMALVPKDGDYLQANTSAAKQCAGVIPVDVTKKLRTAWKRLHDANSSIAEPGDSMEKVNVLSALGEVSFRKGDSDAHLYYVEALAALENLVGPDDQRIAHLNFKICVCLENGQRNDAITFCENAISVCQARLKQVIAETTSSFKAASALPPPHDDDPSMQEKRAERSKLIKLASDLLFKLDDLRHIDSYPTSTTSENMEDLYCDNAAAASKSSGSPGRKQYYESLFAAINGEMEKKCDPNTCS